MTIPSTFCLIMDLFLAIKEAWLGITCEGSAVVLMKCGCRRECYKMDHCLQLPLEVVMSHLQKFRLGKSLESETYSDNNNNNCKEKQNLDVLFNMEINGAAQIPVNENLKVAQALQMQMEVQRKLHEQIEVQSHLQLLGELMQTSISISVIMKMIFRSTII